MIYIYDEIFFFFWQEVFFVNLAKGMTKKMNESNG